MSLIKSFPRIMLLICDSLRLGASTSHTCSITIRPDILSASTFAGKFGIIISHVPASASTAFLSLGEIEDTDAVHFEVVFPVR